MTVLFSDDDLYDFALLQGVMQVESESGAGKDEEGHEKDVGCEHGKYTYIVVRLLSCLYLNNIFI